MELRNEELIRSIPVKDESGKVIQWLVEIANGEER
jgi:hypothetical protein